MATYETTGRITGKHTEDNWRFASLKTEGNGRSGS